MKSLQNPYAVRNWVKRTTKDKQQNPNCLLTDVSLVAGFDEYCNLMKLAYNECPFAWYIHFEHKCTAVNVHQLTSLVPSVLNSFNRSRFLRRARVSGLRMCNILNTQSKSRYITDILAACTFDAMALASGIADFAHLGSRIYCNFSLGNSTNLNKREQRRLHLDAEKLFWESSSLPRHSVLIDVDNSTFPIYSTLIFSSSTLSLPSLLDAVMSAFSGFASLSYISVGSNNNMLVLSRRSTFVEASNYYSFAPDKYFARVQYRHFSNFGKFYRNPNYTFYQ